MLFTFCVYVCGCEKEKDREFACKKLLKEPYNYNCCCVVEIMQTRAAHDVTRERDSSVLHK